MVADLGIGETMTEFHHLDSAAYKEFSLEYFRLSQALMSVGLDIYSLTPLDLSRASAALWRDNTLFEESGALLKMFYQSYGLLDAMHFTDEEKREQVQALKGRLDTISEEFGQLEDRWDRLSPEAQKAIEKDWHNRSKNMMVFLVEVDDYRAAKAPQEMIQHAFMAYTAANPPTIGGAKESFWKGKQSLLQRSRVERAVMDELPSILAGVTAGLSASADEVVQQSRNSQIGPPAGYGSWVEKVQAERQPQQQAQKDLLNNPSLAAAQSFVEKEEHRRAVAELTEQEVSAN